MRILTACTGTAIGVGIAASLLSAGSAHAAPFTPDYTQPANGLGYEQNDLLTPGFSPIQVPAPEVRESTGTTTFIAHPFIAAWVHDLIPIPAGTAVELRGAAQLQLPGPDNQTFIINPNGHCVFTGPGADPTTANATTLAPARIDSPIFDLIIEPTVYR